MGIGTALVAIAAIFAVLEMRKAKYRAQAGVLRDNAGNELLASRADDGALRREVEDLRERVRVLERIVTDAHPARDLAAEIESLRTPQRDTTVA